MVNLCITNGIVVTINDDRDVIENGAVVIEGDTIVDVGPTTTIEDQYSVDRTIDASDHIILPGFISSHAHISDILVRGLRGNRDLYDWLYNVKIPGVAAMTFEEHAIASALYMYEAIQSGFTTVVENATGAGSGYDEETVAAKMEVYDDSGARNVYAHPFSDRDVDPGFEAYIQNRMRRELDVVHVQSDETIVTTEEAIQDTERYIEQYHRTADGRQSIWPSPYITWGVSPEGLRRAYELAENYDVMTTTHVSETEHEERGYQTSVEYLNDAGYLGERALLGHCVHITDSDVRLLAASSTKVAHNPLTNMALGAGFSPVPQLIRNGVTVGLGTDNTSASDTVNAMNDVRFTSLIHNGYQQDAGSITAEKVLEMATIDNARAIGREDDLGSLESGKKADMILLDRDNAHMVPLTDIVSAVVRRAQGFEIDTVVCNGEVIMEDRDVEGISESFPDLHERAANASRSVLGRAGLTELNEEWNPISPI